jgi:hypothetical protein
MGPPRRRPLSKRCRFLVASFNFDRESAWNILSFLRLALNDMTTLSAMFIPEKNNKHSLKESALPTVLVEKA